MTVDQQLLFEDNIFLDCFFVVVDFSVFMGLNNLFVWQTQDSFWCPIQKLLVLLHDFSWSPAGLQTSGLWIDLEW